MKVLNALHLFLDQNPDYKVVKSFSSHCSYEVLEFEARLPKETTVVGRDRHGLYCCWVLELN